MREQNTVKSPSADTVGRSADAQMASRAAFDAALRVTRHHASKFDERLRVLQQQLSLSAGMARPTVGE